MQQEQVYYQDSMQQNQMKMQNDRNEVALKQKQMQMQEQ